MALWLTVPTLSPNFAETEPVLGLHGNPLFFARARTVAAWHKSSEEHP